VHWRVQDSPNSSASITMVVGRCLSAACHVMSTRVALSITHHSTATSASRTASTTTRRRLPNSYPLAVSKLGAYKLGELIGRGGYGDVFAGVLAAWCLWWWVTVAFTLAVVTAGPSNQTPLRVPLWQVHMRVRASPSPSSYSALTTAARGFRMRLRCSAAWQVSTASPHYTGLGGRTGTMCL
jgi:hypothetical protein